MYLSWPAQLYDRTGLLVGLTTAIYAMPFLVSDDRRIFLKKCVEGHVLRFHEADPNVPNETAMVDDIHRQMAAAGL